MEVREIRRTVPPVRERRRIAPREEEVADDGVEFTGKTVNDAIAKAESELSTPRDELAVEILSPGSRGVFGLGAEPARIRARVLTAPSNVREEIDGSATPAPEHRSAPDSYPSTLETERRPSFAEGDRDKTSSNLDRADDEESEDVVDPAASAALAQEAKEVLQNLLDKMGFGTEVSVRSASSPVILSVGGENLGILIGRRGDNLSSLQFMVNLILSKNRRQWPRVVIDVENYRARREESLRSLAERIAYRVARQGRPFTLEAMSASDRRIIHLSLRDRSGIETYSIGEGISRRVVVAPTRDEASSASRDRGEEFRQYS
jgi:spoIIIJ-associated protein